MRELPMLIIENAEIIYPNFSGREGKYNREGDRNFSVMIPEDLDPMQMKADGWNVKEYFRNNEPTGRYYISGVSINFNYYIKPEIHYITANGNSILLTEETLDGRIAQQLDGRGAERYDISIRPREWSRSDGTIGIKGYLDQMRIVAKRSLFGADEDM